MPTGFGHLDGRGAWEALNEALNETLSCESNTRVSNDEPLSKKESAFYSKFFQKLSKYSKIKHFQRLTVIAGRQSGPKPLV